MILEVWTELKEKLTKLLATQTNQPTELLRQISQLDQQISQIKVANPEWADTDSLKAQIQTWEVEQQILTAKLAYYQNWTEQKADYQQQLTISTAKCTGLEQKLEQIRNLLADNQLNKLIALAKKGQI